MHFLGAVIGGDTIEEAEAIIAPWSEYEEVPEYVVQTRDEFLKEQRGYDKQEAERHPESKDAVERLKLDDESALKAYAEYAGRTLDKDGNVISTFNEDSFYDWYEFGGRWDDWAKDVQGVTCRDLLDRCEHDVKTRGLVEDLCVLCADGFHEGGLWNDVPRSVVKAALDEHASERSGSSTSTTSHNVGSAHDITNPASAGRRGRIRRPLPDLPHGRKPDVSGPSRNMRVRDRKARATRPTERHAGAPPPNGFSFSPVGQGLGSYRRRGTRQTRRARSQGPGASRLTEPARGR